MHNLGFSFVTVKQEANNKEDFITFLKLLMDRVADYYDSFTEDVIIIYDGATIHSAIDVRNVIK